MSTFINILLAFFGGVLATCMGALGSVVLCALVAMIGVCTVMAGCEFNVALVMAFGFFLSPHLGLGPAACALGFAKKKGYVEDSKGIALPLIMLGKPSVLVVGGLFGVLSYYIKLGLDVILPGKIDAVSAAIVIIGIIAKILFGNEGVIGKVPEGDRRLQAAPLCWLACCTGKSANSARPLPIQILRWRKTSPLSLSSRSLRWRLSSSFCCAPACPARSSTMWVWSPAMAL